MSNKEVKSNMKTEEEEEEEDEDYQPSDGDDDDDEDGNGAMDTTYGENNIGGTYLSVGKMKAVDDAFDSLFGGGERNVIMEEENEDSNVESTTKKNRKTKKKKSVKKKSNSSLRKQKDVLASIFGSKDASKIISKSSSSLNQKKKGKKESQKSMPAIVVTQKKVITEIKRYAGQEIEVQRTVDVLVTSDTSKGKEAAVVDTAASSLNETSASATKNDGPQISTSSSSITATNNQTKPPPLSTKNKEAAAAAAGIDNLLSQMGGPAKLTTISKTSSDWDNFKDTTGLTDELETKSKGKDAYLVKQDFLKRVDVRRFELEKVERDKKRVANANALAK